MSGENEALPADGVEHAAARGVVFMIVTTISKYGLSLVRMAVLARLLAPEMFGVFAVAVALQKGLETVTALGPDKYLIQRKTLSPQIIGTVWVFRAIAGAAVSLLIVASAPLYTRIADAPPQFDDVIYIIALASFVRGLKSPGAYLAERKIRYGRVAVFEIMVTAGEVIAVIGLAMAIGGAQALAFGLLVGVILEAFGAYLVFPLRWRPAWDAAAAREALGVGKHFLVIAVGSFVMVQGDNLLVGALLGAGMLGYYALAYRLCELPLQLTMQITGRVAFSYFSRVQDDPVRRRDAFVSALELQLAVLAPVSVGVVACAESLIAVLYGAGWEPTVPVLRALGLLMFGRGLSNVVAPYLVANGHFAFVSRIKVIEVVAFVIGVVVGAVSLGLVGAALGAGVGYAVAAAWRIRYLVVVDGLGPRSLVAVTAPSLALSLFAGAVAFGLELLPWPRPMVLAGAATLFALIYAGGTLWLRREMLAQARAALTRRRKPAAST